ncbi:BMP family ABC transporter substrate-binding protein, partial [Clostridium sp. DJ247]|uniref:BMP family ABC transporter substrate-binding protein n=1 Tax=Clostridium sp. DJ247 TaxID=2726188 RepID=UPI001624A988
VATYPVPEVISAINSFALGARLVNPRVRVKVKWSQGYENTNKWEDYIGNLDELGADIFSKHDDEFTPSFLKDMGVDSILCTVDKSTLRPDKYLAASVWNWKVFYQQIFEDILSDNWKNFKDKLSNNPTSLKFWFGMDSGILDFYYSKDLIPFDTQKLVKLLKSTIISKGLSVFTGPIYDESCNLKVEEDQVLTKEEIISMDWLVEAVDTEIPILNI